MEFQTDLAAAKAKAGNITASKALEKIIRVEEQRATARRIQWMNGKTYKSSGLTRAVAPDENDVWKEVNNKDNMEEALREENNRRFTQANQSPHHGWENTE